VYTKTFHLEVYKSESGYDDIPVLIAVSMDQLRARKILSRMKLVGEINKVDPDISSIIFKDEEAKWYEWYGSANDDGDPHPDSQVEVCDPKMEVSEERVYWKAGIEDTSLALDSEMIYISTIKSVADGKDPDIQLTQMQWIPVLPVPSEALPITSQAATETPSVSNQEGDEEDENEGP